VHKASPPAVRGGKDPLLRCRADEPKRYSRSVGDGRAESIPDCVEDGASLVTDPPADVLTRAVSGDEGALSQVMDTVRRVSLRYCRARLGPIGGAYTSADDVAQDVCEAVLVALPRARGPLLAFVYGIAAHKVADAARAAARARDRLVIGDVPEPETPSAGPEDAAIEAETSMRLRRLLDQLPAKQREVVVLRVMVGLPAAQVGLALDMSAGAVRLAQHRALNRLRELDQDFAHEVSP
jgi:RNA polymerase sigma-70 factor, ECF subfamily